jgi:alkylhydroperoxidase/carboxymuconolactone decarboxylase family protein YurZ
MTNTSRVKTWIVVSAAALVIGGGLAPEATPPSHADGCAGPVPHPPDSPAWLSAVQQRDPNFAGSYQAMRERILKDGAIPAKYKLLMGMITDSIAAHPDGVRSLANYARAAGASEAEITEAAEVGYLYGGTASLVMSVNAFPGN